MYAQGFFSEDNARQIVSESVKMMTFDHPHILGLLGICVDAGPAPYIVMPFMSNGSLLSYLRKNREDLVLPGGADTDKVWWHTNTVSLIGTSEFRAAY